MTKKYSSVYDIKDYASTSLVPKYFNADVVGDLNVGLLGYTTELLANATDDTFNTVAVFMNEMFPNLAILPESIYNYGALFQLGQTFAVPAKLTSFLFIAEQDIQRYMKQKDTNKEIFYFYIDSHLIIDVEGIQYMPDYDIEISVKKYNKPGEDWIYTAKYIQEEHGTTYHNSISTIATDVSPYIKLTRITYNNIKYLALILDVQQVNRFIMTENILNNDVVNSPKFDVVFDNRLANFEVFYKAPGSTSYHQLSKRMVGTTPIKEDFCYYRLVDENRLEISFSMRDGYFTPEFNSEIIIDYYTTLGASGNFSQYTGDDIGVAPASEKYPYNNNVSMFAITQSASENGVDNITLEDLKNLVVESFSTVKSYTTENDLMMYFDNFNNIYNTRILFIKRRDDIFERLFSSFTIFKSITGDIFGTNTLNLDIPMPDDELDTPFDIELEQDDVYVIKPGHLFTYKPGILDTVYLKKNMFIYDTDLDINNLAPDMYYDISYEYDSNPRTSVYSPGSMAYVITKDDETLDYENIPAYNIYVEYYRDQLVYINNNIYKCVTDKSTVGEITYSEWVAVGQKTVYKCIADTSGEFDPTCWEKYTETFVFTNPYMMYLAKDPIVVGYYLNTVNDRYLVDYVNDSIDDSYMQFICNSLTVERDAIHGENEYTMRITVTPTSTLGTNGLVYEDEDGIERPTDNLYISFNIENTTKSELAYSPKPGLNKYINLTHLILDDDTIGKYICSDIRTNRDGEPSYIWSRLDDPAPMMYSTTIPDETTVGELNQVCQVVIEKDGTTTIYDEDNENLSLRYVCTNIVEGDTSEDPITYTWTRLISKNTLLFGETPPTIETVGKIHQVYQVLDDETQRYVCTERTRHGSVIEYTWELITEPTTIEKEILKGFKAPTSSTAAELHQIYQGVKYDKVMTAIDTYTGSFVCTAITTDAEGNTTYTWEAITEESETIINSGLEIIYGEDEPSENTEGKLHQVYQAIVIDQCRFELVEWDVESRLYTYEAKIRTNDNIAVKTSVNMTYNKFEITNMMSTNDDIIEDVLIPMDNCILNIWTWYKDSDDGEYLRTNHYKTETHPVTFIYPVNMMRSTSEYYDSSLIDYVDAISGEIDPTYVDDETGRPTTVLYAKLYSVLEGSYNPNGDIVPSYDERPDTIIPQVVGELGQLYRQIVGYKTTYYQCTNISSNIDDGYDYEWTPLYSVTPGTENPNNTNESITTNLDLNIQFYKQTLSDGTPLFFQAYKITTLDDDSEVYDWVLIDDIMEGTVDPTEVDIYPTIGWGQLYKYIHEERDIYYMATNEVISPATGMKTYTWVEMDEDFVVQNHDMVDAIDKEIASINKIIDTQYGFDIYTVPFVKAETMMDKTMSDEFYSYLFAQYRYISNIVYNITNNYGIDMKFYNTYGKSKNFYIGDNADKLLDRVDISMYIMINPIYGTNEDDLIRDVRLYIKEYIESINDDGTNSIYISNLIQALENDFEEIKYMKWVKFNTYDPSYQVIENKTTDLTTLNKEDRLNYTPEYLTISFDDIHIEII